MNNALTISRIENVDIAELANLVNSAYRGESSKKGWTTEADLLDGQRTDQKTLEELIQKNGSIILSARNEAAQIIGCVYLQQEDHQLYLGMLTVAPDIQAKGIGKYLMLAAENYAREIKCTSIIMKVIDIRHELIDWYKRKGYQSTGRTTPFPSDPAFGLPKIPLQFIELEKKLYHSNCY